MANRPEADAVFMLATYFGQQNGNAFLAVAILSRKQS